MTLHEFHKKYNDWHIRLAELTKDCAALKQKYLESKARKVGIEPNHDEHIRRIANGETSVAPTAVADDFYGQWSDVHEALELHRKKERGIVLEASKEYCAKFVKVPEDAALKTIGAALCDLQAGLLEYQQNRKQMYEVGAQPVGLSNIGNDVADLVGLPTDKTGKLAYLLRELIAVNAISKLPIGLR
jgi:hypothetical protein